LCGWRAELLWVAGMVWRAAILLFFGLPLARWACLVCCFISWHTKD